MNCQQYREPVVGVGSEGPRNPPSPVLAGIFALVGISLGQFYNGRPLRGLCWGVVGIALFMLIRENVLIAPAGIFFLAACIIDAYSTAEEIRNHKIPFFKISFFFWLELMLVISLGTALGITTLIQILPVMKTIL